MNNLSSNIFPFPFLGYEKMSSEINLAVAHSLALISHHSGQIYPLSVENSE
jgi:hypothetical protein